MRYLVALIFIICSHFGYTQAFENPFLLSKSFDSFLKSFERSESKSQHLVYDVFKKAHSKFLKNYSTYSQPNDVLERGKYDCLSGTYFLATCLGELGYTFKIIETNYHIFMIVETKKGRVLLESTDRIHGFVTGEDEIQERLKRYELGNESSDKLLYLSSIHLFHEVVTDQLPGLLFFNRAVDSLNKNELTDSFEYLAKAWKIYENPRIIEFTPILIRAILSSKLDETKKKEMVSSLITHQQNNFKIQLQSSLVLQNP